MDCFDYLIVGAGFAGSVCAERLAHAGKTVLLIDQRAHVGGNAYDYYDDAGILVHKYGAHIFHTNSREVYDYLSLFTDWRPYEHRVLAQCYGYLPVPINRTTLKAFEGSEAAAKRALYEPYTRKQWGPYTDALSSTVLARVKVRDSEDDRYFTDTYQAMPKAGYSRLFEQMLAHPNIHILLKTSYRDVLASGFNYGNGLLGQTQSVIYTGPIDEFFDYRFGKLPYRSAHFTFWTFDFPHRSQPVAVVNYPSADLAFTRVIDFKQLTGQQHAQTTVAYEYPCESGEPFWPVPTAASAELLKQYRALAAETPGVYFVGRLGRFQYLDIDQVVAQALGVAQRLLAKEPVCQA